MKGKKKIERRKPRKTLPPRNAPPSLVPLPSSSIHLCPKVSPLPPSVCLFQFSSTLCNMFNPPPSHNILSVLFTIFFFHMHLVLYGILLIFFNSWLYSFWLFIVLWFKAEKENIEEFRLRRRRIARRIIEKILLSIFLFWWSHEIAFVYSFMLMKKRNSGIIEVFNSFFGKWILLDLFFFLFIPLYSFIFPLLFLENILYIYVPFLISNICLWSICSIGHHSRNDLFVWLLDDEIDFATRWIRCSPFL